MAWHPFRNIGWKVLALILGTLLWFTVSGDLAIEREIGVRNYIESGIPLDALVSYDLLKRSSSRRRGCTTAP